MPTNRSSRLLFALFVLVVLGIICRNVYRHTIESRLFSSIAQGDDEAAASLLKQGVFPKDSHQLYPLIKQAIGQNEPITVRNLLQHIASLHSLDNDPTHPEYDSNSLLIDAARSCPDSVPLLLDRGADVNTVVGNNITALTAAITSNHLETARLLMDRGADLNLAPGHSGNALYNAIATHKLDAVKLLLQRGASVERLSTIGSGADLIKISALEEAVQQQDTPLLTLLLATKPSQAAKNRALSRAVAVGNRQIVRYLLAAGVRPTLSSQEWLVALYTVKRRMQIGEQIVPPINRSTIPTTNRTIKYDWYHSGKEMLSVLRPLGATETITPPEIEARNDDLQTPLLTALAERRTEDANYLLARGAKVNVSDREGRTPLFVAIMQGSPLISSLLDRKADPNTLTTEGLSPMLQAIMHNKAAQVRLLLEHGADPNLRSPQGFGLLSWAEQHHQSKIISLLKQAGARE